MMLHFEYEIANESLTNADNVRKCTMNIAGEHKIFQNSDVIIKVTKKCERTTAKIRTLIPLKILRAYIKEDVSFDGAAVFLNGYQSWTQTRCYGAGEKVHNLNKVPKLIKNRFHFANYGDSWFIKYNENVLHGFTYGYITKKDYCDFVGSLNEENAYLIIKYLPGKGKMILESDLAGLTADGDLVIFDLVRYIRTGSVFAGQPETAHITSTAEGGFTNRRTAPEGAADDIKIPEDAAERNLQTEGLTRQCEELYFSLFDRNTACHAVRGYTSWYKHYQNIDEAKIYEALSGINSDNYDLFQIDDGFETYVGDWFDIDRKKFPNGLLPIVEKIHEKGLMAGVWLAPFVAETKSRLYKEHPDWLLTKNGSYVFAGCNWSGDVVLDIRKEEVKEYIKNCLETYAGYGFDFFKLDFLYAAGFCADSKKTRAMIMREMMEFIRNTIPGKLILGCGVPLSSAFNLVDYCRVGPDVSLKFDDVFYMRSMHRERISTKVTLQNTIYRSAMDGHVFRCDPDVYLLRDDDISLSAKQKEALIKLNHLCGAVYMTSDNVADYDEKKLQLKAQAQKLSDARIIDTEKNAGMIKITYILNGKKEYMVYDPNRGELL